MATRRKQAPGDVVGEQLQCYRSMRDFSLTSEPSGTKKISSAKQSQLPFVIQKHAATRLHYDFRLGWNGVLKSWAVAKGPSYVPGDKRLAVECRVADFAQWKRRLKSDPWKDLLETRQKFSFTSAER